MGPEDCEIEPVLLLSFPAFNHLPRSFAALDFGMPSACALLRAPTLLSADELVPGDGQDLSLVLRRMEEVVGVALTHSSR